MYSNAWCMYAILTARGEGGGGCPPFVKPVRSGCRRSGATQQRLIFSTTTSVCNTMQLLSATQRRLSATHCDTRKLLCATQDNKCCRRRDRSSRACSCVRRRCLCICMCTHICLLRFIYICILIHTCMIYTDLFIYIY